MTDFNYRFHQWTNSSNDPETEALDDFLNAHVVSDGRTDAGQMHDSDSLTASVDAFHRRMEMAQACHPGAGHPDPGLWERVIGEQEREADMSTNVRALDAGQQEGLAVPPVDPGPRKTSWWDSRIVNVIAAGLLVVAIGAGYWFSGIGPGGGGSGDDPRRYAAQGLTPEVSPEGDSVGCTVEPLSVDEVMAIVRNPLNPLNDMGVELAASPAPLLEAPAEERFELPDMGSLGIEEEIRSPTDEEFAAIEEASATYYACSRTGTNSQVWALLAPNVLQTRILSSFPVFRDEEEIREWIEETGPESYQRSTSSPDPLADFWYGDFRFEPNSERADAVIVEAEGNHDPRLAWIGTQVVREESGEIVSLTAAGPSFGLQRGDSTEVLVLIQWPGTDTWFVAGTTPIYGP